MAEEENVKFIADENVGGLAKLLRLLGFDTIFFKDGSDSQMLLIALNEKRIILTRDSRIAERRVIASQQIKLIMIESDKKGEQVKQVVDELNLKLASHPFSLCLECNKPLISISSDKVANRVPPFVFKTQKEFVECPQCRRVYWKGTHWEAMTKLLANLDISGKGADQ
jgi:uncharacterized protein with PIN domain